MHIFRSIGVSSNAWLSVLRVALRPALWVPFIFIAVVQLATLALLMNFHRGALAGFMVPVVELTGGDGATHYPFFYYLLPQIQSRVGLIVAVLIESLATAAATLLFARAFGMRHEFGVRNRVLRFLPRILLVAAVPAAVVYGLSESLRLIPRDLILNNSAVRWGARGGFLLTFTIVQAFLAYASAWIVLRGLGPLAALRDSVRLAARTFLPTVIVIGVPVLLVYPFHYISQRTDLFLNKLSPETLAGILAARSGVEIVIGFMLIGSITRLFVWRMEAAR